ncbi:MAG TPA: prenyltransferase/squalene oxidase repeat-containing protein [Thermogutta sp.]|nr:prenyltransferase/squalene oxidase repeat-containing protein [Thermogutta sp.]
MSHPSDSRDDHAPGEGVPPPGQDERAADEAAAIQSKQPALSKPAEQPSQPAAKDVPPKRKRPVVLRAPLAKSARLVEEAQIAAMLPTEVATPITPHTPRSRDRYRFFASCLISAVAHAAVLIALSLWMLNLPQGLGPTSLFATWAGQESLEGPEAELVLQSESQELTPKETELALQQSRINVLESSPLEENNSDEPTAQVADVGDPARPWGVQGATLMQSVERPTGGGLEGRSPEMRQKLAQSGGGTAQSEEAVERGLRWIAAHQDQDGGWSFDLKKGSCRGQCRNPGTEPNTAAATAMALLPFLGAGYTHREGIYEDTLHRGLYYLLRRGRVTENGLDFQEGMKNGMYAQGLAALVLCEAYAMTKDPALKDPAQQAIQFIEYAQDKKGGGWRYRPGEPGDTTVTGWQLMALKSAEMAGLKVDRSVHYAAQRFLDSVASDDGSQYGYLDKTPRRSTTAIGLLCRMYGGWVRGNPPLVRGIGHLASWGPSATDIYYNYYATQVLRHWGGSDWKRWNDAMREYLINMQDTKGHESGSWYFDDEHSRVGGRLYTTAMAVMILEVYYRYMPLYGKQVFPEL